MASCPFTVELTFDELMVHLRGHPSAIRAAAQRFVTRRQNCFSLSSVILWPFSRSRLISMSFSPPSRPRRLQRVGSAAHDDRCLRGGATVHDGAGAPGGARRFWRAFLSGSR